MSRECDGPADVYNERERRARKEHRCQACGEAIRVGDVYNRTFVAYDGTAEAIVRCLRCQKIHEHLRTLGDSDMWPDERLNCGEEYESHWGRPPPPEVAELAFVSAEEMQIREQARILSKKTP